MKRAFTLVEILVVIAVIALLASILFPVFIRAKDQARMTVCISNTNQAVRAIELYANDNGDRCVPIESKGFGQLESGVWNSEKDHDMSWPELLQDYMPDWNVLRCPCDASATDDGLSFEFDDKTTVPPSNTARRHWVWGFRVSVGLNYTWLSYPPSCQVQSTMENQRFGLVPSPAKTILLIESVWARTADGTPTRGGLYAVDAPARPSGLGCYMGGWRCYTVGGGDPSSDACRIDGMAWGGTFPRHVSGQVFTSAFCDGHVRALRMADLLAGVDPIHELMTDPEACMWDTVK